MYRHHSIGTLEIAALMAANRGNHCAPPSEGDRVATETTEAQDQPDTSPTTVRRPA